MGASGSLRAALCMCIWACAIPWTRGQGDRSGDLTAIATDKSSGTVNIPPPNATQAMAPPAGAPSLAANISMNATAAGLNMTGGGSVDSDLDAEIMSNMMGDMQPNGTAEAPAAQPSAAANASTQETAAPAAAPQAASDAALSPATVAAALSPRGAFALGPAAPGTSTAPGPSTAPAPGTAPGPAVALPPGAVVVAPGPLSQMQVEAAETTLEVQMAIDSGNATEAAKIFIETDSVAGVADGLRIAPGTEELPTDVPLQETDPDVVAAKGVAIAVLQAADTDPDLVGRLADAIIASVLPKPAPRFCTTGAPNRTDWWYVHVGGKRRDWARGSDAKCLGNVTKNAVGWGQEPCVSGSTKQECEKALNEAMDICEPILKAIFSLGGNEDTQFCRVIDNPYRLVNRTVLMQKLEDRELMMRVQELDPGQETTEVQKGRKLMLTRGWRSLLVSSGRNVDSLYCARCWPKEVCEDSFAFCKPKPKKPECKKGEKGKKCRKNKNKNKNNKGKKDKKNEKKGRGGN